MRFRGSFTALATPFKGGKVDEASFQALCDWQLSEGTAGLVPVGTTGESPTLSHAEHKRVVELAVEVARGRGLVIAGAGSNSTDEAIDFARHLMFAFRDAIESSPGSNLLGEREQNQPRAGPLRWPYIGQLFFHSLRRRLREEVQDRRNDVVRINAEAR